jgi:hypothetical protein
MGPYSHVDFGAPAPDRTNGAAEETTARACLRESIDRPQNAVGDRVRGRRQDGGGISDDTAPGDAFQLLSAEFFHR